MKRCIAGNDEVDKRILVLRIMVTLGYVLDYVTNMNRSLVSDWSKGGSVDMFPFPFHVGNNIPPS